MAITYLDNGQPHEACWRCRGQGEIGTWVMDETCVPPTKHWDGAPCGGCNGTGNELFMCEPDQQHVKKEEENGKQ